MVRRVLGVAVCGPGEADGTIAGAVESSAGAHHLVISVGSEWSPWSDLAVASAAEAEGVTRERLVPWVADQHDDYGDRKEPFIPAALRKADDWASRSGWTL